MRNKLRFNKKVDPTSHSSSSSLPKSVFENLTKMELIFLATLPVDAAVLYLNRSSVPPEKPAVVSQVQYVEPVKFIEPVKMIEPVKIIEVVKQVEIIKPAAVIKAVEPAKTIVC